MKDTIIQNVWVEHSTTGFWINGPLDALMISGCTVRNTFADGINFHQGVINSLVEQSVLRNLGITFYYFHYLLLLLILIVFRR